MPKRTKKSRNADAPESSESRAESRPAVRPFWSGTITFGLVSIPVDLLTAVRARRTSLKLVDKEGHALGREYRCSKDGKRLNNEDLVRGYETEEGGIVPITDREFESVAPEISSDIELQSFVPAEQIPPLYFQKSYFLSPAGRSSKAYNLLVATMEQTARAGIGRFVMRGHEYLVAIVADNGVLRADTLRYADEIRTPDSLGLPQRSPAPAKLVTQFAKEIAELTRKELSAGELEDKEAEELQALVKQKQKNKDNVIHRTDLESEEEEFSGGAQVLDFMAVLRKSLSKRAVVTNAESSAPISLAERRARKQQSTQQKSAADKLEKPEAERRRAKSHSRSGASKRGSSRKTSTAKKSPGQRSRAGSKSRATKARQKSAAR